VRGREYTVRLSEIVQHTLQLLSAQASCVNGHVLNKEGDSVTPKYHNWLGREGIRRYGLEFFWIYAKKTIVSLLDDVQLSWKKNWAVR